MPPPPSPSARENVIAKFLGSHSLTVDFIDHFRGEGEEFDYNWEERWIRDEGYTKLVPQAVTALLEKTGVKAADIAHFIMPCPFAKFDADPRQALRHRA